MEFLVALFGKNSFLASLPLSIHLLVAASISASLALAWVSFIGIVVVWCERKISAHMQGRLGPMYVGGFHGWLQTLADGIKLMLKEDLRPRSADALLFGISPLLVFSGSLISYACLPFAPNIVGASMNVAVFYILATSSLVAVGTIMAGYAGNNKWGFYGCMRTAAQFLSYEIPVALHLLPALLVAGSLNLNTIVQAQAGYGIASWYLFRNPFLLVSALAYFVSSLAETNRTPFDLPESESELAGGFHVEYSGIKFSLFFMAEYADMFVVSALGTLVFLGGWNGILPGTPFLAQWFGDLGYALIFLAKVSVFIFVIIQLRWTLPRFRIDQLMAVCWKFLIPLGLITTLGSALWYTILRNDLWLFS